MTESVSAPSTEATLAEASATPAAALLDEGTGTGMAAMPKAGAVLAERYRLRERLGRGGMGSVWLADHLTLDTEVAIKLIHPMLARTERARARFVREARAAAALRSPHVVQVLDYGVHEGVPFIAMERLRGESLAQRLRDRGTLAPAEVAKVVEQIARALTKAHAAAIVHRDLKPDNVFLVDDDEQERAVVLDFGVAKVDTAADDSTATQQGAVVGTPYYMSPEQVRNEAEIDGRTDLWALGVVAFECMVGRRPFDGTSVPAVAVKILAEPPPIPSQWGSVPAGFDAWFATAVAPAADDRFDSARELSDALTEVCRSPAPAAPGWSRATVAAVALGGLGVLAGWWWLRSPDEREASAPVVERPPASIAADNPGAADVTDVPVVADVPAPGSSGSPTSGESAAAAEASEDDGSPSAARPTSRPRPSEPTPSPNNVEDLEF